MAGNIVAGVHRKLRCLFLIGSQYSMQVVGRFGPKYLQTRIGVQLIYNVGTKIFAAGRNIAGKWALGLGFGAWSLGLSASGSRALIYLQFSRLSHGITVMSTTVPSATARTQAMQTSALDVRIPSRAQKTRNGRHAVCQATFSRLFRSNGLQHTAEASE